MQDRQPKVASGSRPLVDWRATLPALGIGELTSREAVLHAIEECDRLGRDEFLRRYGFRRAQAYVLLHNGAEYDSKAIAGVAYGYQFPERGALGWNDFVGGRSSVAPVLERLGFAVRRPGGINPALGRAYSWEELGMLFGFAPDYLGAAGGMVPRPKLNALLLITHPAGGKSFDYRDYWDGDELVYTGRGQTGHQVLKGSNRDVADNRRTLYVFEHVTARALRFRGVARCVDWWPDSGPDKHGELRRIYRFRLTFRDLSDSLTEASGAGPQWTAPLRRPRPFDTSRRPRRPKRGTRLATPEEILTQFEKATAGHHDLLVTLNEALAAAGWTNIEEVPAAIDLRAQPDEEASVPILFEAKTISARSEMRRVRSGLAQLLEYRFFYGAEADELCLVTSQPISDERIRFLRAMGVDVIWPEATGLATRGESLSLSIRRLTDGQPGHGHARRATATGLVVAR